MRSKRECNKNTRTGGILGAIESCVYQDVIINNLIKWLLLDVSGYQDRRTGHRYASGVAGHRYVSGLAC